MFDGIVNGNTLTRVMIIIGSFSILSLGIILFRKRKSNGQKSKQINKPIINGRLEGELVYDYGKKILRRSIVLDGSREMIISIGPEILSENHMKVRSGSNFEFTVTPVESRGGDKIINIKCHPPGVLKYKGKVMSEANLFNGEELTMNNIPVRYESGEILTHGKNKLEGRI